MIDEVTMKIRADELIRMALAEDVTSEDVGRLVSVALETGAIKGEDLL